MTKILCVILTLMLSLSACVSLAEQLEIPEVKWEFPVPMIELQTEYAILVNEDHPLDKNYKPSTQIKVKDVKRATNAAVYLEEKAAEALKEMFDAALLVESYTYVNENGKVKTAEYGDDGMVLYLKSGYRSYGTQATTYANYLARNNNVDDGYVAKPGTSEHQTGICADILNADFASRSRMTQDFKWSPEAQWMKENCAKFGFILRFTEDGEAKTGIKFEPWHFRYVGKEIAEYIMGKEITLEDFWADAEKAFADFETNGGDKQEWLEYEDKKINQPPTSYVLEEYDAEGDAEISLVF